MKKALTLLLFLLSISLTAQERVSGWPKGKMPDTQAHQIAAMTNETGREGVNHDKYRMPKLEMSEKAEQPKET